MLCNASMTMAQKCFEKQWLGSEMLRFAMALLGSERFATEQLGDDVSCNGIELK